MDHSSSWIIRIVSSHDRNSHLLDHRVRRSPFLSIYHSSVSMIWIMMIVMISSISRQEVNSVFSMGLEYHENSQKKYLTQPCESLSQLIRSSYEEPSGQVVLLRILSYFLRRQSMMIHMKMVYISQILQRVCWLMVHSPLLPVFQMRAYSMQKYSINILIRHRHRSYQVQ